ncbi:MAG: acetate--CoA ligase [Polyangiales bacterium]
MIEAIPALRRPGEPEPNLFDYERARRDLTWDRARRSLSGLPGGRGLNIAYEAVDRHAKGARRDKVAIRWIGKDGRTENLTYGRLSALSNQFANALLGLGLHRGDRVFALLGRVPMLYVAALGTMKAGGIFSPLFSAFGPEPIRARMEIAEGRFLVTTPSLYAKKVASVREEIPSLEYVLTTGHDHMTVGGDLVEGQMRLDELFARASDDFTIEKTSPEQGALLHFTSGTTGKPKGALHVHDAVVMHDLTARLALDLHDDDVVWCTADPGWVTGTSYGIIAPLVRGVTMIVDEGELDPERWYDLIARENVTVWYTAPTAIRMLMRAGIDPIKRRDLSSLRFLASVGEPLNPDAVEWSAQAYGRPFHDNWWQTETGAIMIANFASTEVRPGSMGKPVPGIDAYVVRRTESGLDIVEGKDASGELALKPGWPSMFREYWGDPQRYASCFRDGLYLTGDLVRRDADGYYWFVSRADDVIKCAGHLIGPFEVESALLSHPGVAEAAVIGKPDPLAGELVKAFVVTKTREVGTDELASSILGHARKLLGPAVAPKEIAFVTSLPRTRTGKIMRRLLRARELGLPEGDISTLEGGNT